MDLAAARMLSRLGEGENGGGSICIGFIGHGIITICPPGIFDCCNGMLSDINAGGGGGVTIVASARYFLDLSDRKW
jgi:hypothetical protein